MQRVPNSVCKYPACHNGNDGRPAEYYCCKDSERLGSWRLTACCPEHFQLYCMYVNIMRGEPIDYDNPYVQRLVADGLVDAPAPCPTNNEVEAVTTSRKKSSRKTAKKE